MAASAFKEEQGDENKHYAIKSLHIRGWTQKRWYVQRDPEKCGLESCRAHHNLGKVRERLDIHLEGHDLKLDQCVSASRRGHTWVGPCIEDTQTMKQGWLASERCRGQP